MYMYVDKDDIDTCSLYVRSQNNFTVWTFLKFTLPVTMCTKVLKQHILDFQSGVVWLLSVLNAAHRFYMATTELEVDDPSPRSHTRKSYPLNQTSDPEEKRKIIGDTFMEVLLSYENL